MAETHVCRGCKTPLENARGDWCVICFKKGCVPCPECRADQKTRRLKPKYVTHIGRRACRPCGQCDLVHQDFIQVACPKCGNDRIVFDETRVLPKEDFSEQGSL